jgi:uncharacterized protein YbbC (DUF1343 family)
LKGKRVGLLCHPASITSGYVHAADVFVKIKALKMACFFGPQHGIRGETQANMAEWEGFSDPKTALPVYSLYGDHRKPTPEMMDCLDVMVVDLQDIGARYYTYIWTMDLCMKACLELKKSLVVLDRPNPINGSQFEGTVLDEKFYSFVGLRRLPIRHAMTIAEIAHYLKGEYHKELDLHIIKMEGWKRGQYFDETGLPWVLPSPNIPTLDSAIVYPGLCLLEGTNLSEGRGTTRPFELFGAPFIDPHKLTENLNLQKVPGVLFRPAHFKPTFGKFKDKLCNGAQIHVLNRKLFKPFFTGLCVIKAVRDLYKGLFEWSPGPYEYERRKNPIDILCGTSRIRTLIEGGESVRDIEKWYSVELKEFSKIRNQYLLY